ncbi:Exosome complex component RRP43 [Sarcoptes scabiei]|uniref:Ribosomal RNA-processing protein 43 n=2 Tax=Sarcoptes scabiei TaxID=52283 RepID=A0A834R2N1_SARSC|nr:Exosome complex component RRP43 [Sarcoptes scabiei]
MQSFVNSGKRPDGRNFLEYRDVLLSCNNITSANGSALIKFGSSSVLCGLTMAIVKPEMNRPEEGILSIDVRFSSTISNEIDNPDRTTYSSYVRECLLKILANSKFIDLRELCLIPRKKAWQISAEIVCLNMDGCIIDQSLIVLLAALKKCRFPRYDVNAEFEMITKTDEMIGLKFLHIPIINTFSIINNNILVDPTMNEEDLSDSLIRIAIDPDSADRIDSDAIYLLEVTGSASMDELNLTTIFQKASQRSKFLKKLILKHCDESSTKEDLIKFEAMDI